MFRIAGLLVFAVIGSAAAAGLCSTAQRRFLATAESGATPVLFRPGEKVELVCRPANDEGCRWTKQRGGVISDQCTLTASEQGVFQCRQGDRLIGAIELKESRNDRVHPYRQQSYHYSGYDAEEQERRRNAYMCSADGKLIEQSLLCDGSRDCSTGEDEESCSLPCGPPSPGGGGGAVLTAPVAPLYPHGASVGYTCPSGLSFRRTLGEYRRTCREGVWSVAPPSCHTNLAHRRPSAASGRSPLGLGPELAVDGQVSTWTMLTPGTGAQSLNVSLPDSVTIDRVLVRTLSRGYEVALISDGGRTECRCNRSSSTEENLTGLAVCSCPAAAIGTAGGSVTLQVLSSGAGLSSLAVSEIAAFENVSSADGDECALLDQPARGRFQSAGAGRVQLLCEEGYRASCGGELTCSAAASAVCRPVTCAPPPTLRSAVITSSNGTGWGAVTEYRCAAGYQLYPAQQRTRSVCRDGLWSLSDMLCLPDSDMRVVTQRLGEQHARSVAALADELRTLLTGQLHLLRQLESTQKRLRQLERLLNVTWEELEEQVETLQVVEQMQDRLQAVEQMEETLQAVEQREETLQAVEQRQEAEVERKQELKEEQGAVDSGWLWGGLEESEEYDIM